VPPNGVVEGRSGPARWLGVVLAATSLLTVAIVVAKAVTWDPASQDDPEVRSIIGFALAVLVLFAILQAILDLVALGLLLTRHRSGFVLLLLGNLLAGVPILVGVPLGWWWPALVAPGALVTAVAGLAADEVR
jgi:hypothetical protein